MHRKNSVEVRLVVEHEHEAQRGPRGTPARVFLPKPFKQSGQEDWPGATELREGGRVQIERAGSVDMAEEGVFLHEKSAG